MAEITQVRTEAEYDAALARISELLDSGPYSPEDEELDRITTLVEIYEDEHYPMGEPDPVSMIGFMLDQQMVTREQLLPLAGSDASLDAILAGQEPIPPGLAQLLYEEIGITTEARLESTIGQGAAESD
jgi:HTH-type transcriptional regulator/antitoxin HigA